MLFCKQFLHVFILLCKGGFTLTAFRARRVHTADSTEQTPGMSAQRLEKNKTILILMHGVARCAAPYTQRVGTMQRRTSGGQRRVTPYRLSSVRIFLQFFFFCRFPMENENGEPVSKRRFWGGGRKEVPREQI